MHLADAANMNLCWAGLLVEELIRGGVGLFCLSPGSRSTPLTLAVAENARARHAMHFDERGAGFLALGWAQATGLPAALVCTSGSAAANYWPAVVEAAQMRVPLVVLTADRPPELLGCGANQAIDQTRLYGTYARAYYSLPCPGPEVGPATLLTTVDEALYRAQRAPAGPVHINCMFREPLWSVRDGTAAAEYLAPVAEWLAGAEPYTRWRAPSLKLAEPQQHALLSQIGVAERGLLVVGRLTRAVEFAAARALAEALGWPVFADVTSGLRTGGAETPWVPHHDLLFLSERFRGGFAPDFVLHLGGPVTSKRLMAHLATLRPPCVHVTGHPLRQDPCHYVSERIETDIAEFCNWLAASMRHGGAKAGAWTRGVVTASSRVAESIDAYLEGQTALTELHVARSVSRLRPEGTTVFLGNSMPVRDMDWFAAGDGPGGRMTANRGASGIDGNLATAAGHARAAGSPLTVIVGDLAALHDLNSLALYRELDAGTAVIVINNDGGGIFSFLPIAGETAHFERYFGTPHGLGFEAAAGMFGLAYANPETPADFDVAYRAAMAGQGTMLIEVRTERKTNLETHRTLQGMIASRLDAGEFA